MITLGDSYKVIQSYNLVVFRSKDYIRDMKMCPGDYLFPREVGEHLKFCYQVFP